MRLKTTESKNFKFYYIIKDINKNGKRTTMIVERLGTLDNIKLRAGAINPNVWLKEYICKLNIEEKENKRKLIKIYSPFKQININKQKTFNGGYLFLQDIYYNLELNKICDEITNKYQFKYDLNSILSNLIYSRIIYPSSKLKTVELSKNFIEQPNFEYQHVLRALEVISNETDFIQAELYKNSLKYAKRNDKILFYDCTNYYFEIEQENGLKQYGISKENKPSPIVQMGLFLDGDGIPLAFDITPGNTNEQVTLRPLEEKIINDFNNSKFVVCTDAGLASKSNRKFNNTNNRRFITTQPLKKLKTFLKDWSLDLHKEWKLPGSDKIFDISKLRNDEELIKLYEDKFFYKERWIKEDGLEQRLIITYSVKYQEYQKQIRETQINRALKLIEKNPQKIGKVRDNDPKRFINTTTTTIEGEVAAENYYSLDVNKINNKAKFDGLYAVCTNLEDPVDEIIKINKRRWEIEESFRIMKSEFKARPVYLSRDDRIKAHFTTCFLALVIYRYLESKLDSKFTVSEIIEILKNMNFLYEDHEGYIPIYKRTNLTDLLHQKFDFRTDYEIISEKSFKKIITQINKQ
ncbi:MAG: IS1634 family transposase [Bacilli bacterium]|nr:IS1634 family transposase [Bacilli bacterium]